MSNLWKTISNWFSKGKSFPVGHISKRKDGKYKKVANTGNPEKDWKKVVSSKNTKKAKPKTQKKAKKGSPNITDIEQEALKYDDVELFIYDQIEREKEKLIAPLLEKRTRINNSIMPSVSDKLANARIRQVNKLDERINKIMSDTTETVADGLSYVVDSTRFDKTRQKLSNIYFKAHATKTKTKQSSSKFAYDKISDMPISMIVRNPGQPRKEFDEQQLIELSHSIKKQGLLQPITVRPKGKKYEIVAGERRFRANKLAGNTTIKVIIKELNDNEAAEVAMMENMARENMTPMEEANGYYGLWKKNIPIERMAKITGRSEIFVTNALAMTNLIPEIQKILNDGKITKTKAIIIATRNLPENIQEEIYRKYSNNRNMTDPELKQICDMYKFSLENEDSSMNLFGGSTSESSQKIEQMTDKYIGRREKNKLRMRTERLFNVMSDKLKGVLDPETYELIGAVNYANPDKILKQIEQIKQVFDTIEAKLLYAKRAKEQGTNAEDFMQLLKLTKKSFDLIAQSTVYVEDKDTLHSRFGEIHSLQKSLYHTLINFTEIDNNWISKGKAFPIGHISTRKDGKYEKVANNGNKNDWKKVRGKKQNIQTQNMDKVKLAKIDNTINRADSVIHTEAFKNWFGDWENDKKNASKVLDKNGKPQKNVGLDTKNSKVAKQDGKPITVYHGTRHGGYKVFKDSKLSPTSGLLYGRGFYFTEDIQIASTYTGDNEIKLNKEQSKAIYTFIMNNIDVKAREAEIREDSNGHNINFVDINGYPQYLGVVLENYKRRGYYTSPYFVPKILKWDKTTTKKWLSLWKTHGIKKNNSEIKQVYLNIRKPFDVDNDKISWTIDGHTDKFTFRQLIDKNINKDDVRAKLEKLGYDGLTHLDGSIIGGRQHRVWIAFESNQIKSVKNEGTFDMNNPDITKSLSIIAKKKALIKEKLIDIKSKLDIYKSLDDIIANDKVKYVKGKDGKYRLTKGKLSLVVCDSDGPEDEVEETVEKSWSSSFKKDYPGGRWITVTDESSPLHGRHLFIVPHENGTATIIHAPKGSGLAHKVLQPKQKNQGDNVVKPTKPKKVFSPEEEKEIEQKQLAAQKKKEELKELKKKKQEELKTFINEKLKDITPSKSEDDLEDDTNKIAKEMIKVGFDENDKKEIEKKVEELAAKTDMTDLDIEQKKKELADQEQIKREQILNQIIEQSKKEVSGAAMFGDDAFNDETMKAIRDIIKDNADDILKFHYETKEYERAIREVNKILSKNKKGVKTDLMSIEVSSVTASDIDKMLSNEIDMKAEMDAHYDLVASTRGVVDADGNVIKGAGSNAIRRNMEKGGFATFAALSTSITGENILSKKQYHTLGPQNASILLSHYMRNDDDDFESKTKELREYSSKHAQEVAEYALSEGDRYAKQAERVRDFGKGDEPLFASRVQASGTSLSYINKAYEKFGQAEGALNQMAEINYMSMTDNDNLPDLKFEAKSKQTLKNRLTSLGLLPIHGKIDKLDDGSYRLTIPQKNYDKIVESQRPSDVDSESPIFTKRPNSKDIMSGRENEQGWMPTAMKTYIDSGKGIKTRIIPDEHQQAAARLVVAKKKVYLNFEAGTGKSLSYLLAKAQVEDTTGKGVKTIIAMPDKLMQNFVDEVKKFSNYNVVIAKGKDRDKIYANSDPNTIVLCNHGAFERDLQQIKNGKFDMVVNDEAHKLSQKTKREESLMSKGLQEVVRDSEYYIAGTGTPTPNDLSELYFHLNLMNPDKYHNQKEFMDQYGEQHKGSGFKEIASTTLNDELSDRVFTVKKTLPTKMQVNTHSIPLSHEQKQNYRKIMQEFNDKDIKGLERYRKLGEIINSNDPKFNPKFDKMGSIIDNHMKTKGKDEKMSIYCDTYNEANAIRDYLDEKYGDGSSVEFSGRTTGSKPRKNKDSFKNDPNVKFSIHTQAGTEGLNLQYDGKTAGTTEMIVFSSGVKTWSTIDQFFSRGNRKGAKKDVDAHILATDNPWEFKSQDRLADKKALGGIIQDSKQYDEMDLLH